jgi:hypothetical protein
MADEVRRGQRHTEAENPPRQRYRGWHTGILRDLDPFFSSPSSLLPPHTLKLLGGLLAFAGFLTARNSPRFLLRLVQAVAPPSVVFSCERFLTAPLRALSPTGLLTATYYPSVRISFVPFFKIERRAAGLLFLFDRPFPGIVGLLGILPVGLLARIIGRFFPAHRAPPATWSDTGFSAPPCGTTPPGIEVTGLVTSMIPARPSPATTSIAATAAAAKMIKGRFNAVLLLSFF